MNKIHLDLVDNQKVWFTSDLHFGHRNVLRFCNRPFDDVKAMGESLIDNWNSKVSSEDIAFILGDLFWFNDSRSIKRVLDRLQGKEIYILAGNHDEFEHYHRVIDPRIHLLGDECVVWITRNSSGPCTELYLSHCPMMTWPHRMGRVPNLFGHIHSGPEADSDSPDQQLPLWKGLQYDVGVDNNNYYPIELSDILNKLQSDTNRCE